MSGYRFSTPAIVCVLTALALAGCGGGSDAEDAVPAELVGTYTTTLEKSDLPNPEQPEFVDGGFEWTMTIATSGGADGGPILHIRSADEKFGDLEGPSLSVNDDRLLLRNEECAQDVGYTFYDNEYSWKLEGSALTIATVENQCADRVAETILTGEPWTKQ